MIFIESIHNYKLYAHYSVNLIEGTVNSLLENKAGDIVGVEYREKHTGILKVTDN